MPVKFTQCRINENILCFSSETGIILQFLHILSEIGNRRKVSRQAVTKYAETF